MYDLPCAISVEPASIACLRTEVQRDVDPARQRVSIMSRVVSRHYRFDFSDALGAGSNQTVRSMLTLRSMLEGFAIRRFFRDPAMLGMIHAQSVHPLRIHVGFPHIRGGRALVGPPDFACAFSSTGTSDSGEKP